MRTTPLEGDRGKGPPATRAQVSTRKSVRPIEGGGLLVGGGRWRLAAGGRAGGGPLYAERQIQDLAGVEIDVVGVDGGHPLHVLARLAKADQLHELVEGAAAVLLDPAADRVDPTVVGAGDQEELATKRPGQRPHPLGPQPDV